MTKIAILLLVAGGALAPAHGQRASGGFVAMLGQDTVQVERFTRTTRSIEGVVVTRSPVTRLVRYRLDLEADGAPARYEQSVTHVDGTPVRPSPANAIMLFVGDSVVRHTWLRGDSVAQRISAPRGTVPVLGGSLVTFGQSYLTYELAHQRARSAATSGDSAWLLLSTNGGQSAPQRQRVWLISQDSVEADYFGVARMGFRFAPTGDLDRAVWTQTTYKYVVHAVADVDVLAIARAWAALDAEGKGLGAVSPRDTSRADLDGAHVRIDYSRPAVRGRAIWGEVVPFDRVWRLGADLATQFATDADLIIGDVRLPAGVYSLWLLPTSRDATLIINAQTGQFGTQYDPGRDYARVPLTLRRLTGPVERLTLQIRADALTIEWADRSFEVPVRRAH